MAREAREACEVCRDTTLLSKRSTYDAILDKEEKLILRDGIAVVILLLYTELLP